MNTYTHAHINRIVNNEAKRNRKTKTCWYNSVTFLNQTPVCMTVLPFTITFYFKF